jgi:hypothetical protein
MSMFPYNCAMIRYFCVAAIVVPTLVAQTVATRPTFEDFAVKQIFRGTPAPPKLDKNQRTFRTVIRTGAKSEVEFSGHYTIPRFGCGAGCSGFYIVDSIDGRVFDGFGIADLPDAWLEKQIGTPLERIDFRQNSRLLKINGCPNEQNCGFYDYLMVDGKGLKLVYKQLLPKPYQY